MAENDALREIPKHDIKVKASVEQRNSLMKDIGRGAMEEIIIPKSKGVVRDMFSGIINMLAEAMRNSIDRFLYPDGNVPTNRSSSSNTYTGVTNYTSYSRPNTYQPSGQTAQKPREAIGQRSGNEVNYIWVESEDKAKQVIAALKEDIVNYGKAKVATLYEMTGQRTTFADFKYGWTDENALGYYYDTNRRGDEFRWFLDLSKPVDITQM